MILFTPYFPGVTNYKTLAADMRRKGGLYTHSHRIITRPCDEEEAYEFGLEVSDMFGLSTHEVLPEMPRTGFRLSNDMFRAAVNHVATCKDEPNPILLYMDPTYRPLQSRWMDTIQSQYYLMKAPRVFGRSDPLEDGSRMFRGPLVIARDLLANSPLVGFIPDNILWREYCRWDLCKSYEETDLIGPGRESVLQNPKQKK
jgi:hypothetical protein